MKQKQEPILVYSGMSDSFYIVTKYKIVKDGLVVAYRKIDVTEKVLEFQAVINRICRKRKTAAKAGEPVGAPTPGKFDE